MGKRVCQVNMALRTIYLASLEILFPLHSVLGDHNQNLGFSATRLHNWPVV